MNNAILTNLSANSEYLRVFLIKELPDGLTRAARHIQFHDNYIYGTDLRTRWKRIPETNENVWTLEKQQIEISPSNREVVRSEIVLTQEEHDSLLGQIEGREIRKNRYPYMIDGINYEFDVYIGPLWGVITAMVRSDSAKEMAAFQPPEFAELDITDRSFFLEDKMVDCNIDQIRNEIERCLAVN